ncbi:MAG: tRNA (adenosine(37)-N6)-threonylcarbamoyltransferase complex ATPase subunit type 1 TsaE [Deltaproteobacteria bacterium]|nr:tRNA (adenosine(37)-N6)-threonylcarbamoyltransferase complex ATPase subunit type 1 TsaE [Deltaproteobacteria bacterium]
MDGRSVRGMKDNNILMEMASGSAEQTFALGKAIGKNAAEGDVFALSGELGAGKTCFACGLARGIGVDEQYVITSPTFTLINEYPGRCRFYHFDVYRLNQMDELIDLGYDEYVSAKGVVAIEWAEKIKNALPDDTIKIDFVYVDENKRIISISGPKKRVRELVKDIKGEV